MSTITNKMRVPTDWTLHKKAQEHIAQGYLTNSKRPESLIKFVYPTHLKRGIGCHVFDYNDKKYIDFITGLGTNLFGYANETIISAAIQAIREGNLLSLASGYEISASEKLKEIIPFVDCFKFLKTGSDACSAAIKIARAKTGRDLILSDGYHGWNDDFISITDPALGVPKRDFVKKLTFEEIPNAAAVIIEPVITDWSLERMKYLHELRAECTKYGTLLIFDEIITFPRFQNYSVSRYNNVVPDLICIGKAIANGFPLAAVGGKYDVMNSGEYFVSSTYAGCMDAMAACIKSVELLQKTHRIEDLWLAGAKFIKSFNEICPDKLWIEGYPTRGVFKGDEMTKALFFQEACYAGILFGPSFWFNFSHIEHVDNVLNSCRDIFFRLKTSNVQLDGEMPKAAFAQKVRAQ